MRLAGWVAAAASAAALLPVSTVQAAPMVTATPDYPGATWIPASTANYTVADRPHDYPVQLIVIHDIEGSYSSAISAFQNPARQASAHYVVSKTGQVAQMVQEKDIAWHAGNWDYNTRAIGIEHEGFAWTPGTFTETEYQASAHIIASICSRWGVPMDRTHVIGHNQVPDPNNPNLFGGEDHHTDPGPYWNWSHYMDLANQYASTLPSPPHMMPDPVAINGLTDVTVSWKPAQTCHAPITGYTVTGQPGNLTQNLPASATSANFPNLTPGTTYTFTVTAINAEGQDSLDTNPATPGRCNSVTLAASPATPQPTGTTLHFTAASASCPNPLYQFLYLTPGSTTWTRGQAYSSSATWSWNSTAQLGGAYQFRVLARDAASPGNHSSSFGAYDDRATISYTVTPQPCTSLNASGSPASPVPAGTAVTVTATAAGCPNPRYEFWMRPSTSATWTLLQAYTTSASYVWNTAGLSGTVYLSVWTRDASSSGAIVSSLGGYDMNRTIAYNLTGPRCLGVTIAASPASPQNGGAQVTFTATASGCITPGPRYEFWIRPATSSSWTIVQPYSSTGTFSWNTSGAAGTYYVSVWAKDAASTTATFDANATASFVVNRATCRAVTISASPASPRPRGTQVTFTATASQCTNANPQYEFWIRPASSNTWTVARPWSASNQFVWTNGNAGGYYISVWVKDAASPTATFDANGTAPYTLT